MIPREFFPDSELMCHDGCGLLPPIESVERLYVVRIKIRKPMAVSSASRCPKHNKKVGGKSGSIHLPPEFRSGESESWGGGAFDISTTSKAFKMEIMTAAIYAGFTGFGIADDFLHIDDANRPHITYWTY